MEEAGNWKNQVWIIEEDVYYNLCKDRITERTDLLIKSAAIDREKEVVLERDQVNISIYGNFTGRSDSTFVRD